MTEIDQLIAEGERLIAEQKYAKPDVRARIIQQANEYRDLKLVHSGTDISEDILFKNLSDRLDTTYSRIIAVLEGVTQQLNTTKRQERHRSDVHDFFWTQRVFWEEELFLRPDYQENYGRCVFFPLATRSATLVINVPTRIEQWVLDCLRNLERAHRLAYKPDVDRHIETMAYATYAATYAIVLHHLEEFYGGSYSEEVRWAFQESFRAYFSVYKSIGDGKNHEDLEDLYPLLDTEVQVIVGLHLFKIKVWDRNWQDALRMYAHTIACFSGATVTANEIDSHTPMEQFWDREEEGVHKEAQTVFDHIRELPLPLGDVQWTEIAIHVDRIIKSIKRYWGDDDAQLLSFWTGALWWLRGAKLEPGELRDELKKEEDEKAEQRVRNYFFDDREWSTLPERTQKSLVEADRVWLSSKRGNPGIVLDQIKIATEEVMFHLFWKPCFDWIDIGGSANIPAKGLVRLHERLESRGDKPALSNFISMLKAEEFSVFCQTLKLSTKEQALLNELPRDFRALGKKRRIVVHGVGEAILTREQVAALYKKFLGLGEEGILPRLARIKARLIKRDSPPVRAT